MLERYSLMWQGGSGGLRWNCLILILFLRSTIPTFIDAIRKRALSFFEKLNRDKRLSLCDVISYLLIKEHFENIPCLAFDDDFDQLGLNVLR